MKPESSSDSETEPINSDWGIKSGHPAFVARREAMVALNKLVALAENGNSEDALHELHSILCVCVSILNKKHLGLADSVIQWPILLPREKYDRIVVAEKAKRMSIGTVRAVAMGQPEKLNTVTNKGFALLALQRLDTAKRILRMGAFDGNEYGPGDERFCNPWIADADFMARFQDTTRIGITDVPLLLAIRDLPTYSPETRPEWITVILRTLKAFPDLVPGNIRQRKGTTRPTKKGPRKGSRGNVEEDALTAGLKNVPSIPRIV